MLTYITAQPAGGNRHEYSIGNDVGDEEGRTMISGKAVLSKAPSAAADDQPAMTFDFGDMEGASNHTAGTGARRVPSRRMLSKNKSTDSELSLTVDELGPSSHAPGRVQRRLSKSTACSELSLTIDDFGLDASSHHVPRGYKMQNQLSDLVEGPSGFVMSDSQLFSSKSDFNLSCWDANSNDGMSNDGGGDGRPPMPRRKNSNDSGPPVRMLDRGPGSEYSIDLAGDGGSGGGLERGGSRRAMWRATGKDAGSDFSLDMSSMEQMKDPRHSKIQRFPSNFSDLDSIDEYSIPGDNDEDGSNKSPEEVVEVTTWAFVNGRKRTVRFDPRDDIHEVEAPDPEDFSILFYGVHELQSMMDDMRMEEREANERRRALERNNATRGLSSTD